MFLPILLAVASAVPPPSAPESFSARAWSLYATVVVHDLWPDKSPFSGVVVDGTPDTIAAVEYDTGKLIIGYGLIAQVREEDDVAFVAAHEAAHLLLQHQRQYRKKRGSYVVDYALMERQEKEADAYAFKLLRLRGRDPCAGRRIIQRLFDRFNADTMPLDPFYEMQVNRLDDLKKTCPAP